jgi:hypothetical protein
MPTREKMVALGLAVWLMFTGVGLMHIHHQEERILQMHILFATQKELRGKEHEIYIGVAKVNKLCERSLVHFMERLGLDIDSVPVLTTAILGRAGIHKTDMGMGGE